MNVSKLFGLLLVMVAVVAIVELVMAPSPHEVPNPRVSDGVYQRIVVGMTERQLEGLLGQPSAVRGGELVRFHEPDSEAVGFEILERPRSPARELLNIYCGLNDERIFVLVSATRRAVLAAQYSIGDIPVLYRGYSAERAKSLSPLSLKRSMSEDVRNKVERFLINWLQHKDRSSVPGEMIVHWERSLERPELAPPPPPPDAPP